MENFPYTGFEDNHESHAWYTSYRTLILDCYEVLRESKALIIAPFVVLLLKSFDLLSYRFCKVCLKYRDLQDWTDSWL